MLKKVLTYCSLTLVLTFGAMAFVFGADKTDKPIKEFGVYEYVIQSAQGTLDEISTAIKTSAGENGWRLLAKIDAGVPKACAYQARVFVFYDADYAKNLLDVNRKTAPFAVVDRINLFEDENGIHVAVVNPHSINRTVMMDDAGFEELTETHLKKLRGMITSAVQGEQSRKQFGQIRKKGHIDKTMGVMAGGGFIDKIEDEFTIKNGDINEIAAKVRYGLNQQGRKWGMHLVYELDLPGYDTFVFGTTGTPMDNKSFDIVKAGADESRKEFKCAGLTHAAAYPMEVVVAKEGDDVKIRFVDTMFRMKMYFEDAGKWAFMKNMKMPGSIQKELLDQIKSGLKTKL